MLFVFLSQKDEDIEFFVNMVNKFSTITVYSLQLVISHHTKHDVSFIWKSVQTPLKIMN